MSKALTREVLVLLRDHERSHLNGGDPRNLEEAARIRRCIDRIQRSIKITRSKRP